MSEKFDMKLVIDAVTTPLLYDKLSQAGSARVRAALLRSLAEAALRGHHITSEPERQSAPRHVETAATTGRNYQSPTGAPQPSLATRDVESDVEEVWIHPVNGNDRPESHDANQLADAFGAFF